MFHWRDGEVVRLFASQSVDLGFISQVELYQKSLKMVFTTSLPGAQYKRDSMKNKPASLLVVSLDETLKVMPPSSCGKQVTGPSSPLVVVAHSDTRNQTEHEVIRMNE